MVGGVGLDMPVCKKEGGREVSSHFWGADNPVYG